MGVGIHRSKIALYIYDKTFEDNDEDKIVDADFIERNMGFYEILDEWKNLINHDVVSELVEPLYDKLESFAEATFDAYLLVLSVCDGEMIVGCGAIGPYWGKADESSLFNIFVLPEYQGKGAGRKITLF